MDLTWYWRRARAMEPGEVLARLGQRAGQWLWRRLYFARGTGPAVKMAGAKPVFHGGLARTLAQDATAAARARLVAAADALLAGKWPTFAVMRDDVSPAVDWHLDVKSGERLPDSTYTFDIRIHGAGIGFDTKYVWELSRHHHTTVLAMAYWLTGDARYAEAAAGHVSAWCAANPFLNGVHWSSGIEIGMRLIAFAWTRRLLEEWPGARAHFEECPAFVESVYRHQWWLARRMSSGSSANNHLIYEAAGLYVAACAMPWFAASAGFRTRSRALLEREFRTQTFASGLNRELGTGYNGYVFEALALCLIEGELCGDRWPQNSWALASDILNRLADLADCRGHPPCQGDCDDAVGLLLDAPDFDRWADLLQLGAAWFGRADWWPDAGPPSLRAWLWDRIAKPPVAIAPPTARQSVARDAGLAILRARSDGPDEIYCAVDAGPLGYLSIAAHGHADALAVELRVGGQQIFVDSGTFSYTAPTAWREFFRGTSAHNTLELGGQSQSESGGPFLWVSAAAARLTDAQGLDEAEPVASVEAEHDGYMKRFGARHIRRVTLDRRSLELAITDRVGGTSTALPCRLFFHLHPAVRCVLAGSTARIAWMQDDKECRAEIALPESLAWEGVSGSEAPILGWHSPSLDIRVPATTLVGQGLIYPSVTLQTVVRVGAAQPQQEAEV